MGFLRLLPRLLDQGEIYSAIYYNEHSQGHTAILTGRTPMPAGYSPVLPQSTDWPSIASVVGNALAKRTNNLPPAVVLPERLVHNTGRVLPGQFGGLMGSRRDPWFIEASPYNSKSYGAYPEYEFHFVRGREQNKDLKFQSPNLSLPQGLTRSRLADRNGLLGILEGQRRELNQLAAVESFDRHRQAAISLLTDPSVQRAFDVHNADPQVLDRYGRNSFGWSLLMARQLVQAGVSLVQVNLGNNESWDTHDNNFPLLRDCLLPPTDRGISALLDDLQSLGMLDETLIVMVGEMGRTPRVNGSAGRDHWPQCGFSLLTGGGVKAGMVYGATDKQAAYPVSDPVHPSELVATIYQLLGIDPHLTVHDRLGRPFPIARGGEPVRGVMTA